MKHLFIVNPAAGKKDSTADVARLAGELMPTRGEAYEIYVSRAPMDAAAKIEAEAPLHDDLRIYACGGDGTLNECVNGAAGLPNTAVTHFPCGTGNDFIKTFGNDGADFSNLSALIDGEIREIDLIDCSGRYSVNICSVGVDARIAADVHKYSGLPFLGGNWCYVFSTLINVVKGLATNLRVSCCGHNINGAMTLLCACNGRHYGGVFTPMPFARPDDGVIEFLIVKKVSRLNFIQLVKKYAMGRFTEIPKFITYTRGGRMEIESDRDMAVNIDGEIISARQVSFSIVPAGVRFIFPRGLSFFSEPKFNFEEFISNIEISAK